MKYFYDRTADSLYIAFAERKKYHDSVEVVSGVVLDFDARGHLLGIDLEHASDIVDVPNIELYEQPADAEVQAARLDGAELRQKRERIGMSQVALAKEISVSPNTIARWERGELKIEHPRMLQLALMSLELRRGKSAVA